MLKVIYMALWICIILDKRLSFIQLLFVKSQDTHKKKKEKSVCVSSATCDPQRSVTQEAKQNCCRSFVAADTAARTRQCPHILFWRKEILHLFHALHLTIDQAIEMKQF